MAVNLINIGNIANDGTGDDLREAFIKVNQNFEDLDLRQPESTVVTNAGIGEGLFSKKLGDELVFKSLRADPAGRILVTSNDTDITLALEPVEMRFNTDSGTHVIDNIFDSSITRLRGYINEDDGSRNSWVGLLPGSSDIVFRSYTRVKDDANPILGGDLDANQKNITNGNFTGSFFGKVYGIDIRQIDRFTFDFGQIYPTYTNPIQYLLDQHPFDMGTFTVPGTLNIDLGSIL